MNYSMPRELRADDGAPTGKWHYTTKNDERIWATGYCAQGCPGHDTPEGAAAHQRQYNLDTNVHMTEGGEWRECAVCGTLTKGLGTIPLEYWSRRLCDAHRTREHVEALYDGPGTGLIIHS